MKWEKPEMRFNKFDKENIVTASSMTVKQAREYVDIDGAEKEFDKNWLQF